MKQLIIALAFGAAMTLLSWAGITIGSTSYSADTLFRRQIGPGIVNTIIRIPDYPLNVYLLEADMSNPYNRVETTVGQGRLGSLELLTAAAKRVSSGSKRVVAGCNANFWCVSSQSDAAYMLGSPYGAVVRNDTTYLNTNNVNDTWDGGPSRTGAVAIDHNKQLYMGHFTWKAAVAATKLGTALEINKVNRRNLDNEMCLWNEAYGRTREFEDNWTSAGARGTNNADNYYLDFAQGSGWNVNRAHDNGREKGCDRCRPPHAGQLHGVYHGHGHLQGQDACPGCGRHHHRQSRVGRPASPMPRPWHRGSRTWSRAMPPSCTMASSPAATPTSPTTPRCIPARAMAPVPMAGNST
jgi:hypothetical protein